MATEERDLMELKADIEKLERKRITMWIDGKLDFDTYMEAGFYILRLYELFDLDELAQRTE